MTGAPVPPPIGSVGTGTVVHSTVQVFGGTHVRVGANSRIDCYSVITAGPGLVEIGDWVHMSAACMIFGTAGVTLGEGAALSARAIVYSTSDDMTSGHLGQPQFPDELRHVDAAPVVIERQVMVGASAVILPGVRLAYGCAVGALSLVKDDVPSYAVVAGIPSRVVGWRDADQLARCEEEFQRLRRSEQG